MSVSTPTSSSVNGQSGGPGVGGWQKKVKKYDVRKDPLALAGVQWDPKRRPKPEFISGIWEEEEIEDLSRYVDWHRQHPHCITPRPLKEDEDFRSADKKLDEGNPLLVYQKMPGGPTPIPPEFLPTQLGRNCDIDEVSVVAMEVEYEQVLYNRFEREDPWYTMSVKDQLEQSHIDGSHTTVKSKRSTNTGVMSQFNKEAAWQVQQYGNYAGGYPTVTVEGMDKLTLLSLRDKSLVHDENTKVKVGPWSDVKVFSQFTKDGTALLDYQKLALERNVKNAVDLYEQELREERAAARLASSRKISRNKKRRAKGKVVPEEGLDEHEKMKRKLGNNKQLDKMTRGFVLLAKKAAKHSKRQKNLLETQMDLIEACNKLRILTVNAMLLLETTNPNMKTAEDEPIFLHMFSKAVKLDQISGHCRVGSEPYESSDRKKTFQILQALAGKCDINTFGREGITAAHMAAIGDNSKLIDFLAEKKANLELFSRHDDGGMTPLMMAAKFGHVYVCADLVRHRVDVNKKNKFGMTALHHAGLYGQTRTAKFLLRVGADKFLIDNEGRTAGRLAMDSEYMAAGQAISAFARRDRDVSLQLDYLVEQNNKLKKPAFLPALSRTKSFFNNLNIANVSAGMSQLYTQWKKRATKMYNYAKKEFCDYFEIDFELVAEDEDDESEQGEVEVQPDDSEYTDGESGKNPEPESNSRLVNGGFDRLDGFETVSTKDNVIGFNDNF